MNMPATLGVYAGYPGWYTDPATHVAVQPPRVHRPSHHAGYRSIPHSQQEPDAALMHQLSEQSLTDTDVTVRLTVDAGHLSE